jgi:hypothetical protein
MAEKDVRVKVVLHAPSDPQLFHFESDDLPIGKENRIYFSNCGKTRGFMIHFDLDDTNRPGYRFPTRQKHGNTYLEQALWVAETGGCPGHKSTWPVFRAMREEKGGGTLVVKNTNPRVQDFWYTLRVVQGADWLNLDPGGSNQNGGEPPLTLYASIITGALVGLGAALLPDEAFVASPALVLGLGGALAGLIVGWLLDRM